MTASATATAVKTRILEDLDARGFELTEAELAALEIGREQRALIAASESTGAPHAGEAVKSKDSPDPLVRLMWAEISGEAFARSRRAQATLDLFTYSRDAHAIEDRRISRCLACGTQRWDGRCPTCALAQRRTLLGSLA